MALAVSQTAVCLREVLLRDKPDEMLLASAKGSVPVLIDSNKVVDESLDIMKWALKRNDPDNWLMSKDDPLIAQNDGPFKHHLDRYKYSSRFEANEKQAHRDAGFQHLEQLDKRLADSPFLAGTTVSFADNAIFPFVRQFRIADEAWFDAAPIKHVQNWLSGLVSSARYQSVMKKYPVWKETGEAFRFPECAPTH